MTSRMPFYFVDVFATRPLTGNPLSLVPDADDLDEAQMRAIAREFNQSETTFLQRPSMPGATVRLRSFTPAGVEVGGAGHNALGACLGLDERDLLPDGDARVVSTGAGHLLVPASDRGAVDRAAPDPARLKSALRRAGAEGCYLYSRDPVDAGSVAYARFFNPTVGIAEDPATGTAAGPLAARLVAEGWIPDESTVIIEQGYALGRPSRISVSVSRQRVRVGGSGLVVAEGTLVV
jgi:trans-2,3-dihydro-3-hydroxyanthranilate isomerase